MEDSFYKITLDKVPNKECDRIATEYVSEYNDSIGVLIIDTVYAYHESTKIGGLSWILERVNNIYSGLGHDYKIWGVGFDESDLDSWDVERFASDFDLSLRTARKLMEQYITDNYSARISAVFDILYGRTDNYELISTKSDWDDLETFIVYDKTKIDSCTIKSILEAFSKDLHILEYDGDCGNVCGETLISYDTYCELRKNINLDNYDILFDILHKYTGIQELDKYNTCIWYDWHYIFNEDIGEDYF